MLVLVNVFYTQLYKMVHTKTTKTFVWLLVCGVSVQLTGSKNGGVTLGGAAQSCEFGLNSHSHPPAAALGYNHSHPLTSF